MNATPGTARKEIRRAKRRAREEQGSIKTIIKYIALPCLLLWLILKVIPDTRLSLRGIASAVLGALWVWWGLAKLAPGLEIALPILGFHHKQTIDDLRDDIQDRTGQTISRSAMTELLIGGIYGQDSALAAEGPPYKDGRAFVRWRPAYEHGWGRLIFFPEKLYGEIRGLASRFSFRGRMVYGPDSLNEASLVRAIVEAVCESQILEWEGCKCNSLEEMKQVLRKRLSES